MNPTAALTLDRPSRDREWVWLSESLTATLRVEGPAPLVVAVPKEWLRADAAGAWQVTALANPKSETLADGRAAWTIQLRLDPYVPGESVTLAFAPLSVTAGGRGETVLELPSHAVFVKTRFENPKATDVLPITGYEEPPPAPPSGGLPLPIAIAVIATVAIAVALRRRRKPAAVPAESAESRLAKLSANAPTLTGREFAEELATIVRLHLESALAIPATRRTTGELGDAPPLDRFKGVLDWCDVAKFGGAEPADRSEMLAKCRELLGERGASAP